MRYWENTLVLFKPIYWRIRWRYYWTKRRGWDKFIAPVLFLALLVLAAPALAQEPNASVGKITNSSGNVAAATATATIAAAGGQLNYVCGFIVTGTGATTAVAISPTLAGMSGGTMTFTMGIIAGVLLQTPTLIMNFEPCQPASAVNTAITLSVPSFGAGNTNASANIWGYRGSP